MQRITVRGHRADRQAAVTETAWERIDEVTFRESRGARLALSRGVRGPAWLCLLGLLLPGAGTGCREQGATDGSHAVETVERSYELHCVGCHGAKGEGAWGSNIQGLKTSVEEIARVIAEGEGKMPGYKGHLSGPQMRELAELVKTFK